ncbi:MAG: glutathione S-transferase family protein [Alphaproteobacteria bacterium]|nr:glutathione S-transferase family protein [Alphaproteobacteria bacterium]
MTIYGDSISGNCHKVKFVADYLGIPYLWIETSVLQKETRTPEFLALNPAGQVPLVAFPDGRVLAQSNAIMLHLAEGSALIPAEPFARAQMFQWLFWEQYSHETAVAVLRFRKAFLKLPECEIDPALWPRCTAVLALMENHLVQRRYFVDETLSLADIALLAYTRLAPEAGLALPPEIARWVKRIEVDLKITAQP